MCAADHDDVSALGIGTMGQAYSLCDVTGAAGGLPGCLLEAVCRLVTSGGSATVRPADVQRFSPIIAAASASQVTGVIVPAMSKGMKARGESILPNMPAVIAALPTRINGAAAASAISSGGDAAVIAAAVDKLVDESFAAPLQTHGASSKDELRAVAADVAASIGRVVTDPSVAISKVVAGIITTLTTKKATVPLWQARHGLVSVLAGLGQGMAAAASVQAAADDPRTQALKKMATDVLSFCVASHAKEAHEGTKTATAACLGAWLPFVLSAAASALPADVAAFVAAGLKSSSVAGDDGFAATIHTALTAPAAAAASSVVVALAAASPIVDALADIVVKTGAAALGSTTAGAGPKAAGAGAGSGSGGAKGSGGAPAGALYALASLLTLASADSKVADKLNAVAISAGAAGASASSSAPAAAAGAVKKPVTATTAAAPKGKAAAPPAAPASTTAAAAAGAKSYGFWELFTHSALSSSIVFHPLIVGSAGRSSLDVLAPSATALTLVAVDALSLAMSNPAFAPKIQALAYTDKGMAAVLADLSGTTAGNARAGLMAAIGASASAVAPGAGTGPAASPTNATKPAAAAAPAAAEVADPNAAATKKPGALFVGLVSLLLHPAVSVRKATATLVATLYTHDAHSKSLSPCLTHALWDRVRSYDVVAPSLSSRPSALDTGVGDGPVFSNAGNNAAAKGKLVITGGGAAASASADCSDKASAAGAAAGASALGGVADDARVYSVVPAPHLLQAALVAILCPSSSASASSSAAFAASSLVPTALFMCCHPSIVGADDDYSARSKAGIAPALINAGVNVGDASAPGGIFSKGCDARTRVSCGLWKRVYTALASSYSSAAIDAGASSSASSASPSAAAAELSERPSIKSFAIASTSLDALLQTPTVADGITRHMTGQWGVWAPLHTSRVTSSRVAALLMKGVAWMNRAAAINDQAPGCGGRYIVTQRLLPMLLETIHACNAAGVSESDAGVWRTREGAVYTDADALAALVARDPTEAWRQDHDVAKKAHNARIGRITGANAAGAVGSAASSSASSGAGAGAAGEEADDSSDQVWLASLRAEVDERRRAADRDAVAKAAIETAKAKGGAAKATMSAPAGFEKPPFAPPDNKPSGSKAPAVGAGKPGAASGGAGSKAGSAASSVAVDDPALKEQAAVRARVQSVYNASVGSMHALAAVFGSSPAACQALVPHTLHALLPALGSSVTVGHAAITLQAVIASALANTVLAIPSPCAVPVGLATEWIRCLAVIQAGWASGAAGAHTQPAGVSNCTATPVDEDGTGVTGANLTQHANLFKRLLAVLAPRVIQAGQPGNDNNASSGGSAGGYDNYNPSSSGQQQQQGSSDGGDDDDDGTAAAAARRRARPVAPLPPSAFCLLFPLLRSVLTASPPLPLTQQALAVLGVHASLPHARAHQVDLILNHGAIASGDDHDDGNVTPGAPAATPPDVAAAADPLKHHKASLIIQLRSGSSTSPAATGDNNDSDSSEVVIPLGPGLADGAASTSAPASVPTPSMIVSAAGPRFAAQAFASYAACNSSSSTANACATTPDAAAAATAGAVSVVEADLLALRCLRTSMATTSLHVLRTAPRTIPAPETVLLTIVRGGDDIVVQTAAEDDDEDGGDENGVGDRDEAADEAAARAKQSSSEVRSSHAPVLTSTIGEAAPLLGPSGLLSPFAHVRAACLTALDSILTVHAPTTGLKALPILPSISSAAAAGAATSTSSASASAAASAAQQQDASILTSSSSYARTQNKLLIRLWVAVHDGDEDNAATANIMWGRHGCELTGAYASHLLPLLSHPDAQIRLAAGRAIAGACTVHPATVDGTIKALIALYSSYAEPALASVDGCWKTREGVIQCISACAEKQVVPPTHIPIILPFLIQRGLPDTRSEIRSASLTAGRALVDCFGPRGHTKMLLPVLETFLEQVGDCFE